MEIWLSWGSYEILNKRSKAFLQLSAAIIAKFL